MNGVMSSTFLLFRDSLKEVILGDLYIPRTHLASTRVGQRSYFIWTKLERKPRSQVNQKSESETSANTEKPEPQSLEKERVGLMKRMLEAHSRKLTTLDLRDFLRGNNPRNFVFILTGRAFRKLRMLHEELKLPWFGQIPSSDLLAPPSSPSLSPVTTETPVLTEPLSPIFSSRTTTLRSPPRQDIRPPSSPSTSLATTPIQHIPSPGCSEERSDSFWIPLSEAPTEGTPHETFESSNTQHDESELSVSTISSQSKQRREKDDTLKQDLGGLVGRYQLEPYEDTVAASIIFGALQSNIPEPAPVQTFWAIPTTFFSERSSWMSASSLSIQLPSRTFARIQEQLQSSAIRRKKPVRNPVGPPLQAIRAAQAGTVSTRFPFPARQAVVKSPKKTRKSSKRDVGMRLQSFTTSDRFGSHLSGLYPPNARLPIGTVKTRDVFWLFGTEDTTGRRGRLQGLRVRAVLPPQEYRPPTPLSKHLAEPLRRLGLPVPVDSSDDSSDEEGTGKYESGKLRLQPSARTVKNSSGDLKEISITIPSVPTAQPVDKSSRFLASWVRKKAPPSVVPKPWGSFSRVEMTDAMEPLLNTNARGVLRFKPLLPTPLEDSADVYETSETSRASPPIQTMPLADVSHAESQALGQTATSLHFHPQFAFPTRSSYAGPPSSTRLPGLSQVVPEKSCLRPMPWGHTSETSISSEPPLAVPSGMFPATSRLAHKGLIPATNQELMLLTVVIEKRHGPSQYPEDREPKRRLQGGDRDIPLPRRISSSNQYLLQGLFAEEDVAEPKKDDEETKTDTIINVTPIIRKRQSIDMTHEDKASDNTAESIPLLMNGTGSGNETLRESGRGNGTINLTELSPMHDNPTKSTSEKRTEKDEEDDFEPSDGIIIEHELIRLSLFEFLLRNTKVYARMSPEDKTSLIASLKDLPGAPAIGMCGDGPNDCGALRAADVGVSLNDATASVAAPFTAKSKSVQGCVDILREGE